MNVKADRSSGQLYAELNRDFHLKTVSLQFGTEALELIKVADLDELMEKVTDADQIPFWAELWPASLGLARYILNNGQLLRGKKVLELGAGIGLAGIAARIAGANLLQTDYSEAALKFIRVNSLRNGLTEPQLLLADWRRFPNAGLFDLILGADILYEKTLHPHLVQIITNSLKPNGVVWLADPGRDYALEFVLFLLEKGWSVRQIRVPIVYEAKTHQIDIYQIHRGN
ncbi:MAG: methyltransferase domain-containing protein [Firmicutes bacterium]|nr:methyltransferase domain-containing protein [Bacillota bacterium]